MPVIQQILNKCLLYAWTEGAHILSRMCGQDEHTFPMLDRAQHQTCFKVIRISVEVA